MEFLIETSAIILVSLSWNFCTTNVYIHTRYVYSVIRKMLNFSILLPISEAYVNLIRQERDKIQTFPFSAVLHTFPLLLSFYQIREQLNF